MKWMRNAAWAALVLGAVVLWSAEWSWGMGEVLGETKEQLKLKYDITVEDHGTGRVTLVFTLTDEGRLKPLEEIQFYVPAKEKGKEGRTLTDLAFTLDLVKQEGKWVGRVHLLKDYAERAEIWLNTHTLDGKLEETTRLHHIIKIKDFMKSPPAAAAPADKGKPAADPAAGEPPAPERKK